MKLHRIIPMVLGVAVLLFGIYLVSTHGSVAGVYLPGLLGLPECSSNSGGNSNTSPLGGSPGCSSFTPYSFGVGTVVAIFGLGLLASSFRSAISSAGAGSGGMSGLPPEMAATLEMARSRMASMPMTMPTAMPPSGAPGIRPNTVYCSKCGQANLGDAKFCHQCGSAMPVAPPPPTTPPGT